MNWIPIPFPISIQFTLPTVHTVEGFLSTFIHAAKSNVSWCTSHSTTECPWLSSINKAVKWVLSRHPISKMTIFPEGLVHKVLLNPNREHFIKGLLIVTDTSKNLKYTFQNSHVSISSQLLWSVFPSSMKIWLFWIWAEKKNEEKFSEIWRLLSPVKETHLFSEVLSSCHSKANSRNSILSLNRKLSFDSTYFFLCSKNCVKLSNCSVIKGLRSSFVYAILEVIKHYKEIEFKIKVPFVSGYDWSRDCPGPHTSGKAAKQLHSKDTQLLSKWKWTKTKTLGSPVLLYMLLWEHWTAFSVTCENLRALVELS